MTIGNKQSAFATMGAQGHFGERAKLDYYATPPKAVELLLQLEKFDKNIWECACGELAITNVLRDHGYNVLATDIVDRGGNDKTIDFLSTDMKFDGDIITNPPYKDAQAFVEKAMDVVDDGHKIAMFLKLTFLEGKCRKDMFKRYPPKTVYVSSSRLVCAKNGDFEHATGNAIAFAWFIWEKGFNGTPVIKWFN